MPHPGPEGGVQVAQGSPPLGAEVPPEPPWVEPHLSTVVVEPWATALAFFTATPTDGGTPGERGRGEGGPTLPLRDGSGVGGP